MAIDPRTLGLLERYPDALDDEERSHLADASNADPAVAALMEELDLLEGGRTPQEWPPEEIGVGLSSEGRARMEAVLAERRERPSSFRLWPAALAALLAFGWAWWALVPDEPTVVLRGQDWGASGELIILADAPLADGAEQTTDRPVRFQVLVDREASLVLVEIQGSTRSVVWPRGDEVWMVSPGLHTLTPPGASEEYTPAGPGDARYVLYGSPEPLDPTDLKDSDTLDATTVRWRAP